MLVRLHSQATTTPKVRAEIQASDEAAWILAERHGTTEQTVYKWRHRDSVEDRSHTWSLTRGWRCQVSSCRAECLPPGFILLLS